MSDIVEQPGNSPPERDERGLFKKGNHVGKLGGRPPAIDIRKLAEAEADKEGYDLRDALWGVIKTLFARAQKGDVAAAKLLLDRLTTAPDKLSVRMTQEPLSDSEVKTRLSMLLTSEAEAETEEGEIL